MIAFACVSCQKRLSVKDEFAGKKVKCPGCGNVMPVPDQAVASSATLEQPRPLPSSPLKPESREVPPAPPTSTEPPTPPPPDLLEVKGSSNADTSNHDASLTDFLGAPQADDELGRLGGFRILKVLGHGGMGVVYQGEDPR